MRTVHKVKNKEDIFSLIDSMSVERIVDNRCKIELCNCSVSEICIGYYRNYLDEMGYSWSIISEHPVISTKYFDDIIAAKDDLKSYLSEIDLTF